MIARSIGGWLILLCIVAFAFAAIWGGSSFPFDPFVASGSYPCSGEFDDPCGPPANDDFADAVVISPDALPVTEGPVRTKEATSEAGEPSPCAGKGATVWYEITPAVDIVIVADTFGSTFDTALAAYTGSSVSSLTTLACNDDVGSAQSRITFVAQAGVTYYLQAGGFFGGSGRLVLNVDGGPPPANDDFVNAEVVPALPLAASANTRFASTETGEPSPSCVFNIQSTVWYSFTPPEDVLLLVDTGGSNFAAVFGVWTEGPINLVEAACSPFPGAAVPFQAVAGETYLFQIGGQPFAVSSGDLVFSLEVGVPPPNDDFADATVVGSLPFSDEVSNVIAAVEPGEPTPSCLGGERVATVWYSFTPASDTLLVADTIGSEASAVFFAVYQGESLDGLTQVACARPSFPAAITTLAATGGETYFFQVGGESFGFFSTEAEEDVDRWQGRGSAQAAGGSAGHGFFLPTGNIVFNLDTVEIPPCAPAGFSVADPVGDTIGFEPIQHDVVAVSGGSDGENVCLTVSFDGPIDAPGSGDARAVAGALSFDTDNDSHTGSSPLTDVFCDPPSNIGSEVEISLFNAGAVVPFVGHAGQSNAFLNVQERSFELIIPLDALGGDDSFDLTLVVGTFNEATDCVPNGGSIRSPVPVAVGDANCDMEVSAIDAVLVLQFIAGLLDTVPCDSAADVNHDGEVNALDATIILQAVAGLLDGL